MRSFRQKPVGWCGESYRHYLAAKGVRTAHRYFQPTDRQLIDYVDAGVKPVTSVHPSFRFAAEDRGLYVKDDDNGRSIFVSRMPLGDVDKKNYGVLFGYPFKAIEGFKNRVVLGKSDDELWEENVQSNMRFIRAGISASDLEYLEYVPFNMSPDEVRSQIEMRKSATTGSPQRSWSEREAEIRVAREGFHGQRRLKEFFAAKDVKTIVREIEAKRPEDITPQDRKILQMRLEELQEVEHGLKDVHDELVEAQREDLRARRALEMGGVGLATAGVLLATGDPNKELLETSFGDEMALERLRLR